MEEVLPLSSFLFVEHLEHFRPFSATMVLDGRFAKQSSFLGRLMKLGQSNTLNAFKSFDLQAIVVLIRPTFVRSDILASSTPKAGVSTIFSLRTFEHLFELYSALTYNSLNVILSAFSGV